MGKRQAASSSTAVRAPKPPGKGKTPATPADTVRLNIKRIFLDEIVAGTKKVETREASIPNCRLLCKIVKDEKGTETPAAFKDFKKVYFYVERNANPAFALVELKGMAAEEYLDPDTGGDTGEYYIELELGAVLETNIGKAA
jgi:hypothetical protein